MRIHIKNNKLMSNLKQFFFIITAVIFISLPMFSNAQSSAKDSIKLSAYGFLKNDLFWDTRQTVAARENHFLLFPKPVSLDANGDDINNAGSFNFLSIQSRIGLTVSGAKFLNANASAKIEADFFGQSNVNINLLRLRHAFIKLNWTSTELLIGQYWIPMFIPECFPGTISFNTGVPFQPFGRNPQIRLSHQLGKVKLIAIANSQRDYTSIGPDPSVPTSSISSGQFLMNSGMPELSAQAHFVPNKIIIIGASASYKKIVPQLVTPQNYATQESVGGYNALVFAKIKTKNITFKLQGIYGQNMADVLSIGGIAISDSTEKVKGYVKYTTLNTASAWIDIQTNGTKIQVGIFGGYSKNLGANTQVIGPKYGLGTNIESMYRISPRISYTFKQLKFAIEGEYTVANYGSTYDSNAIPTNITPASNFRLLFSTYFMF